MTTKLEQKSKWTERRQKEVLNTLLGMYRHEHDGRGGRVVDPVKRDSACEALDDAARTFVQAGGPPARQRRLQRKWNVATEWIQQKGAYLT